MRWGHPPLTAEAPPRPPPRPVAADRAVLVDIQAVQNPEYAERGVARHAAEFSRALCRARPDLVGGLLLNPDLPAPKGVDDLLATGLVRVATDRDWAACRLYHVIAPFELELGLERIWPAAAARRGARLVVTLHDLIPRVFPQHYHADPGLRRRYLAREEVVRAADRVLSVSRTTRREAIDRLGIDPHRIRVIGAGVGEAFRPPTATEAAWARAREGVERLQPGFLLSVGGADHRKNLHGLVAAYALLPQDLRTAHQLVIACRLGEEARARLHGLAAALGVGPRVLLTGYVDDATLVALYQAADLFVFPSLYEGYGLPVAEAMACGTPVVASSTSALGEITPGPGQFDPSTPTSIAAAIRRALTDPATAEALAAATRAPMPAWEAAAQRAGEVYDELLGGPPPASRRRLRVGFVTPLPPQRSGVAVYNGRLLEALAAGRPSGGEPPLEVDVFVDNLEGHTPPADVTAPPGMAVHPVRQRAAVEAARGGYDVWVYTIGNSEYHTGALGAARRRPGIVLAHDVAVAQLYAFAAHHGVLGPGAAFAALLGRWYPERPDLEVWPDPLLVAPQRFAAFPVPMARELIAGSLAYLTTSRIAAGLARVDALGGPGPDGAERIGVLVHACRVLPPGVPEPGAPLIASFGVVNDAKDTATLIEAFALLAPDHPGARLVFVGHGSRADLEGVNRRAVAAGVGDAVVATGSVDGATWDRYLARATIAVQLRRATQGEFSGAVAEALAAGVPTIVTDVGAAGDLPDAAAVKVPAHAAPAVLAIAVGNLLDDPAALAARSAAARAWAATRTFPMVAAELAAWIRRAAAQSGAAWDHFPTPSSRTPSSRTPSLRKP